MPVSQISANAATRLGPNDWCQVRPCNAAGRQEDRFLAKIASVMEIAPPGYPTTRRPRELNFRKPDVVIGTRDWKAVERFLYKVEPDRNAGLRETRKHHVGIVLRNGERWYLNLIVSETARRSRITSMAAAKLGRGSVHDRRIRDNMDCKPEDIPGWRGWPEGGCPMKGRGNPGDYAKMEAGGSIRRKKRFMRADQQLTGEYLALMV
jgi:hypothetical protein